MMRAQAVIGNPTKIFQGRIGPYPLHKSLSPMIVITVWGGEKDLWDCGPPLGLCSDYRPTTQAGCELFLVDAERGACRVQRDAWTHVATGEHAGVQPVGADDAGVASQGL